MENPVKEIRDVVRSLTEPYEASVIAKNVEKYFTEDAFLLHPLLNQPHTNNGRNELMGLYKMLAQPIMSRRVTTVNNRIEFHHVMFNEDMTRGALELTEHLNVRWNPLLKSHNIPARFLVLIDLKKCSDGKYRIWRQHDSFMNDISVYDRVFRFPGSPMIIDFMKSMIGTFTGKFGKFLLDRGWFGP